MDSHGRPSFQLLQAYNTDRSRIFHVFSKMRRFIWRRLQVSMTERMAAGHYARKYPEFCV